MSRTSSNSASSDSTDKEEDGGSLCDRIRIEGLACIIYCNFAVQSNIYLLWMD
jgi:hypothetical protein